MQSAFAHYPAVHELSILQPIISVGSGTSLGQSHQGLVCISDFNLSFTVKYCQSFHHGHIFVMYQVVVASPSLVPQTLYRVAPSVTPDHTGMWVFQFPPLGMVMVTPWEPSANWSLIKTNN